MITWDDDLPDMEDEYEGMTDAEILRHEREKRDRARAKQNKEWEARNKKEGKGKFDHKAWMSGFIVGGKAPLANKGDEDDA